MSNLRDFGMGKKGSEEKIIEETRYLSEVFENFKGKTKQTTYCLVMLKYRHQFNTPMYRTWIVIGPLSCR